MLFADVAELADALDLGSSVTDVGVQVPSSAPHSGNLRIAASFGEMSEWLKEPVLKTGDGSAVRGFESRSLLQLNISACIQI